MEENRFVVYANGSAIAENSSQIILVTFGIDLIE